MKQVLTQQNKVEYYHAEILLRKSDAGNVQDTIKLIESKSEMPVWYDNKTGKKLEKGASFGQLMNATRVGDNGSRRLFDAFADVFGKSPFPAYHGSMDIYEIVDKKFGEGLQSHDEVYGTDKRQPRQGDIIKVQEWAWYEPEKAIQGRNTRWFMVSEVDFDEFDISTGVFL